MRKIIIPKKVMNELEKDKKFVEKQNILKEEQWKKDQEHLENLYFLMKMGGYFGKEVVIK